MKTYKGLKEYLFECAKKYQLESDRNITGIISALVDDVEKALSEHLEIFPVCHHSPASAFHMIKRLQEKPFKAIYMELCEDMITHTGNLKGCTLPVALQAFAGKSDAYPGKLAPYSVIAPLSVASAEYQAIAYALQNKVELVFVDRAADYIFQWEEKESVEGEPSKIDEENDLHKGSYGIRVGDVTPTFKEFFDFMLKNARVKHFSEWWDQYVDRVIIESDYSVYREVMYLIGSLFRRLGRNEKDTKTDRLREQYMWTRIKSHMKKKNMKPDDALYVCGAIHAVSDVREYGVNNNLLWEIPSRTDTEWLYGIVPSSFLAIEYQFSNAPGTMSLSETTLQKSLKENKLKSFTLETGKKPGEKKAVKSSKKELTIQAGETTEKDNTATLKDYLVRPPALLEEDKAQLIAWCSRIVAMARRNGYMASTADSISIFETSILLAKIRDRNFPSIFDFQDAAVTCLEKDYTPKKHNIENLCGIMLGHDRIGTVGYESLPPLVQNIYDRLKRIEDINIETKTTQRVLMDFHKNPGYRDCSDVLWRLQYLIGSQVATPIMGKKELGYEASQESWDIRIGKYQGQVIQLGYEGVTLEQVIEQRIQKNAYSSAATPLDILVLIKDSLLFLFNEKLVNSLGKHALSVLLESTDVQDAPEIFIMIREFIAYYQSGARPLPDWLNQYVSQGYAHYISLLPGAFADRGVNPGQLCGMLSFVFNLESLALASGCNREQLFVSINQIAENELDPRKAGLLYSAKWLLKMKDLNELDEFLNRLFETKLMNRALPDYLNGFLLALDFAVNLAPFIARVMAKIFGLLDNDILMPLVTGIILMCRSHKNIEMVLAEAGKMYGNNLEQLVNSEYVWEQKKEKETSLPETGYNENAQTMRELIWQNKAIINGYAFILGETEMEWGEPDDTGSS
ncbi:MAG: hypothetical protein JXB88_10945 [Spirochaetales bacterium]|nr:hypothetical protein [Spirochaetales bacterium]